MPCWLCPSPPQRRPPRHTLVAQVLFAPPLPAGERYTHLITSALPPRVTLCKHLPVVLRPASPAEYEALAAAGPSAPPLHLFPEGGMTHGRAGMMRFSRGFTRIMGWSGVASAPGGAEAHAGAGDGEDAAGGAAHAAHGSAGEGQQAHWRPAALPLASAAAASAAATSHTHSSGSPPPGAAHAEGAQPRPSSSSPASPASSSPAGADSPTSLLPVVPAALRLHSPLAGVRSHTLTSSFLANLFWLSFSPWVEYEVTVLPPMAPRPGELRGGFANRVQVGLLRPAWVCSLPAAARKSQAHIGARAQIRVGVRREAQDEQPRGAACDAPCAETSRPVACCRPGCPQEVIAQELGVPVFDVSITQKRNLAAAAKGSGGAWGSGAARRGSR
jgi:hypothetical protein